VRRVTTTLGLVCLLVLCLGGCGVSLGPALSGDPAAPPSGKPFRLGGIFPDPPCQDQWVEGALRPDVLIPASYIGDGGKGMAIEVDRQEYLAEPSGVDPVRFVPIYWPFEYTGLRLAGDEVAVLDGAGHLVATTGSRYRLKGQWRVLGSIGGPKFPYSWIDGFVVCPDSGSLIPE
jgi:hypothetical protein